MIRGFVTNVLSGFTRLILVSPRHQEFVEEMESVQRLKGVYDKFQIAVVDVDILPFQVKFVPFIEYRTKTAKKYYYIKEEYDVETFRNFMREFA